MMTNAKPTDFLNVTADNIYDEDENKFLKKIKQSPVLPLGEFHHVVQFITIFNHFLSITATVGFLGIGAYRVYNFKSRGTLPMSLFLIHTRLAAQGFGVAVLGSIVIYQLGNRVYNSITGRHSDSQNS